MSLSKQLLILISTLFLMIFSVNFILSVNNIKSYLEGESMIHAQDTATSLGLSLSPYMADEKDPILQTMMSAIFDRGYYKEVKLSNVDGHVLVALTSSKAVESVPNWFIQLLPMQTAVAESEISSGWNISGVVSVAINPGYAYFKLYDQVKTSFYYSLAAFVGSVALLLLVLQITLSSLKNIGQMAEMIENGNFKVIEKLPWTLEVRKVASSMNSMSKKLEQVIKNLNNKLEGLGRKLQLDELTGLNKKNSFELDMKEVFASNTEAFILLIKIDALGRLVKELDENAVDQFIKQFSTILKESHTTASFGELTAYRLLGSEFVILAREGGVDAAENLAASLSKSFSELGEKYYTTDIAHIGVTEFDQFSSTDNMLLAAKEAYEQAQMIGENSYFIRHGEDRAVDMNEWKQRVFDIVDRQDYTVSYIDPVVDLATEQIILKEAFSEVWGQNGEKLAIGTFVSVAEKFVKIVELDQGVTQQVIRYIKSEKVDYAIAINLSNRTVKNSDFRSWLAATLKKNPDIAHQLVFSFSAYAVAKEFNAYQVFIDFAHQYKAKVIIKRYESHVLAPRLLKRLKPDFIRLARDISLGIESDSAKQDFVKTVVEITDLIEISVLAENVGSDTEFEYMAKLGVKGASR